MMPNPFDDREDKIDDESEEDDTEEEPLLILKCRLMVERKPRSCNGQCVKMNQATWEMDFCDNFLIVDATDEETAEYDSLEEN